MIKGLGIDIVENSRIEKMVERWGSKFLNRVYTAGEIEYCLSKIRNVEHLAGRFAAKEAVVKMLGFAEGVSWQDIEIKNDEKNKPYLILQGKAQEILLRRGIKYIHISISHERDYSIAQVIGED